MAEIAIAAAVAAAVSAGAYTVNYALTPKAKPIERGRLRGDIQIQDSRYGHMIPIILGNSPLTAGTCDPTSFRGPVLSEFFTRDDAGDLGVAPNGEPWSYFDETGGSCSFGIDDNEATLISGFGHCHAVVETGIADGSAEVTIKNSLAGGTGLIQNYGITFRCVDDENYWYLTYSRIAQSYRLYVVDGGLLQPPVSGGATDVLQDGDKMRVTFCGSTIKGYLNSTLIFTFTDSRHATATKHGLQASDPDDGGPHRFDNFIVKQSVQRAGAGGGVRLAGNVIQMSDVRKVETITPAEGGKGFGNKNPDTKTIQYFCDLAIMFGEGELDLGQLYAGTDLVVDLTSLTGTGVRDGSVSTDPDQDNLQPLDPGDTDVADLPRTRYGAPLVADENGTMTGSISAGSGADFRFYSGSETQLPDPWLETVFGVGNTPAYLGRCYIVLENFEVGKYGAIPNFTAILNNKNLYTADTCLDHLFQRVGLEPADFDVSNVSDFHVRGIPIVNREGPKNTVELIGTLFGFDVVETNGEIICVERGGAPSFAITEDDLGTVEVDGTEDPQSADIPDLVQNELQLDQTTLPRRLDLTFFDPDRKGENNTQGAYRLEALGLAFVTQEVNAVLTVTEGRQLAQRLLDTAWVERVGALRFRVPHTFASQITAAAVGTVTRNGITHTVRVKEVNGFVPGPLEVVATVTRAASYTQTQIEPGEDAGSPIVQPMPSSIPATTVATFIDRLLRDRELQDGRPGFYVAACSFGNGSWGGANVYCDRGSGYAFLINVPEQATMGVVDVTDATIAGASEVDVQLYGEQTLPTGVPTYVMQGELIYSYSTAVQVSTSPNVWRVSDLTNIGARCTTDENGSHAAGERFVVLNEALRYISVEASEIDQARDYKVPTVGQDINDAGVISFTLTAPNVSVTTPADWSMTAGAGSILHTWTPFADECVMSEGLVYEIREDSAGSPGALIFSGNAQPYKETGLAAGTYTRHFRARTRFAAGAYLVDSITVTATSGSDANFDLIAVDPVSMLVVIDPLTMNVATES